MAEFETPAKVSQGPRIESAFYIRKLNGRTGTAHCGSPDLKPSCRMAFRTPAGIVQSDPFQNWAQTFESVIAHSFRRAHEPEISGLSGKRASRRSCHQFSAGQST
jgi:hypothetical protein